MPRKATGNPQEIAGHFYARIHLGGKALESIPMPVCKNMAQARERAAVLADLAGKLRAGGHGTLARSFLERAGARTGKALDEVLQTGAALCRGDLVAKPRKPGEAARPAVQVATVRTLGERWTSGELARAHPDHIRVKRSADKDIYRFERYVYPIVENVPIVDFTLDHAEAVMRSIPEERAVGSRRQVAQLLHRLLAMAVFPLRLRESNPMPKGFLPKVGKGKAKGYLFPKEDARLMASAVPLCWRIFYGFLDREGPRAGEAAALDLGDVNLDVGAVNLDENKTDDPRTWALSSGVAAALRAWVALRAREAGAPLAPSSPLFVDEADKRIDASGHLAGRFRLHLLAAGVDRAELHKTTAGRQQIRAHDLRATFITVALASGRSESYVADRTGHRSSTMINRYRRAARSVAELGLGELGSLVDAIPELAATQATELKPEPARESAKIEANAARRGGRRGEKRLAISSTSAPWRNGKRWGFKIVGEAWRP